jgi:hypothetical protein
MRLALLVLAFALLSGCHGFRDWVLYDDERYYAVPAIIIESNYELTEPQKHMARCANPGYTVIFHVRPRVIVIPEGCK